MGARHGPGKRTLLQRLSVISTNPEGAGRTIDLQLEAQLPTQKQSRFARSPYGDGTAGTKGVLSATTGSPPLRVFFDTEFTSLGSDPRLLSIGMVADDGQELYLELSDGWTDVMCSPWVREHVLPMLGKGEQLTRRDAGRRIGNWLEGFTVQPKLLGDTDWDTTLLTQLLEESGLTRTGFRVELLVFQSREQAKAFEVAKQQYFELQNSMPHHALTDAHAFRSAWMAINP